jgi:hypothetical protein
MNYLSVCSGRREDCRGRNMEQLIATQWGGSAMESAA